MRKYKSRAIKHAAPSAYAKCLRNFTYAKWLRHASAQAKWPTQLLKSSLLYKFHHFKKNRSSIVGWAPLVDNDWHALMQKMNKKLENAQQIYNVRPWTERLLVGKFRFAAKIASAVNSWASITSEWYPYQSWKMNYCVEPRRRIGRPAKRWDDQNWIFCTGNFPFIMVSGGQIWDMELSWEGFCKVVLGMLMFGCSSFPMSLADRSFDSDGNCVCCVCLRSIFHIPPPYISRISNATVLQRNHCKRLSDILKFRQLCLFQFIAVLPDDDVRRPCIVQPLFCKTCQLHASWVAPNKYGFPKYIEWRWKLPKVLTCEVIYESCVTAHEANEWMNMSRCIRG